MGPQSKSNALDVSSPMRQKKLIGLIKEVDLPDWLLSVESVASVGKHYE